MDFPRPLFTATPSRLSAFDCPRRYWFSYLARPVPTKGPPWAHNTIGAAVHVALARWWRLEPSQRTPDGGANLVRRHWQTDGFADPTQALTWREQAADWVRQYLADQFGDDTGTAEQAVLPRGVERTVSMRTARLAVSGRADRIDERDGELVIVDYKSGRGRLDAGDAAESLALALYALATERSLHQPCRRVELHHLPSGEVAAFDHTDGSLQDQLGRAERAAAGITAASDAVAVGADPEQAFPPVPGSGCSWCDFRRHCPAGQAAAPARNSWDGLGELTATRA